VILVWAEAEVEIAARATNAKAAFLNLIFTIFLPVESPTVMAGA
jgi:hypothetical protein